MSRRLPALLVLAALATACSPGNSDDDVQPLPEQSADSAKALMVEAERASANAAARAETERAPARSAREIVNEETP
jgi:outer membrane PBP1 activator LpoA protein